MSLAPGYSYAEEFAGTNGIGTAISSGQQALVDGREHYTHQLGQFACAGAPIHHPTRRAVIGILDLTSWAHAPGAMLMALASATAREIEGELLAQTSLREFALFQEYLKACQQSGGPVMAINNDVVMMNEHVRLIFDAPEQQALLAYAADMLRSDDRTVTRTVELPSARTANIKCASVGCEAGRAGTVFRVRLVQEARPAAPGAALIRGIRSSLTLPGVIGSSAIWTRCVQQVNSCYEAGEWLALAGESGTGKLTLLRAIHQLHNPTRSFRNLEPPEPSDVDAWLAELDDAVSTPGAMVVLEHADRLDEQTAELVADQLLERGSDDDDPTQRRRVAITVTSTDLAPNALVTRFRAHDRGASATPPCRRLGRSRAASAQPTRRRGSAHSVVPGDGPAASPQLARECHAASKAAERGRQAPAFRGHRDRGSAARGPDGRPSGADAD